MYSEETKLLLPTNFRNVICKNESAEPSNEVVIRSNIFNMTDIAEWMNAFSKNTNTQWIVETSKPSGKKFECMKMFACHHSSRNKAETVQNKNKKGISKNTDCKARIIAKVKLTTRDTQKRDPFVKDALPGIIRIRTSHNHALSSPSALKCLTPLDDVKDQFFKYFSMNMTIACACRYHENRLLFEFNENEENNSGSQNETLDNGAVTNPLANSRWNPTKRMVQHWFNQWKLLGYEQQSGSGLKEKLEEKIEEYKKRNVIIKYEENPFVLVVVTPIMKRIHQIRSSKDIVFIDSTSCCDSTSCGDDKKYSITFLLTPTYNGAIPCGVLITKEQTTETFTKGFQILQSIFDGCSFYKQNYPTVTMTDNCNAEITSATTVWPKTTTLLCIFRVLQDVLRWVHEPKHKIPENEQKNFMWMFQTILYCTDKVEAENAFVSAIEISKEFPRWQKYLRDQYQNREKWCLAYRIGLTDHHANNYAEISIRVFKENILDRAKGYNIVSLLEFIATTLDPFYQCKLKQFYSSRNCRNQLYMDKTLKVTEYLKKEDIIVLNEHLYLVPSQTNPSVVYSTNTQMCNCVAGQSGKFCKHQAAIYKYFDCNYPATIEEARQEMAYVSLGENMPGYEYSLSLHSGEEEKIFIDSNLNCTDEILPIDTPQVQENNDQIVTQQQHTQQVEEPDGEMCLNDDDEFTGDINIDSDNERECSELFTRLKNKMWELHHKFGSSEEGLIKLTSRIEKIVTRGQWENFIHTAGNHVCLRRRSVGSKIKIQPTSIQIRKTRKRNNKPKRVHGMLKSTEQEFVL